MSIIRNGLGSMSSLYITHIELSASGSKSASGIGVTKVTMFVLSLSLVIADT